MTSGSSIEGKSPWILSRLSRELNFSWEVVNADLLGGLSDEKVQCALADQQVSEVYRLIGKRDNRRHPLPTIFLTFDMPSYLHQSMSDMKEFPLTCRFLIQCSAADTRNLDTPSNVDLTSVGIAVRSHGPTHRTLLCELLRSIPFRRQKLSCFPG